MSWSGKYKVENENFASGGRLIKNDDENRWISGNTTFTGETGVYDIIIGYHDVDKESGQIKLQLNGTQIDSWTLTKNLYEDKVEAGNFTTHTISNVSVSANDALTLQSIVDKKEEGYIDYIEFIPFVENTPTNNVVLAQDPIRVEAEHMSWSGKYKVENESFASGGRLIKNDDENRWISGNTTFTGETGVYDIKIGYHDVKDETGQIKLQLNGTQIDSWALTKNLYEDKVAAGNFTTHTISNVSLNANDALTLQSIVDKNEEGYIDYIEFIPVAAPTDPSNEPDSSNDSNELSPVGLPPELQLGKDSDILRGGAGNDGIDGGEGNDIIFGENELNDSSNIAPLGINGAENYGYSSYILTSQALTWEEAQGKAKSYGGNLVTINDAAEEAWLKQTFGINQSFHIGFTDTEIDGKWISGEKITYQPSDFNSTETKTSSTDITNQYEKFGIIEIDWSSVGGNDTILGGAGDDQVYGNSGNDLIYGDNTTTVKTPGTQTFQQGVNGYSGTVDTFLHGAISNQDKSSATSLNIDSYNWGSPVHSLIRFEDIFGSQAGQIALDDTINSAILEIDVSNPGNSFKVHELIQNWADTSTWNSWGSGIQANGVEAASTPVATTNWVSTGILQIDVTASLQAWQADPTTNKGWAFLPTGSDGVYFDSAEGSNAPRLVVDVNQGTAPESNANGEIYNGSRYLVTDTAMTWSNAQAYAESIGGYLVTINDASEEQWLKQTFGTTQELWIGLSDKETEGTFKWASGEAVEYTNWVPNEPNNGGGNSDYVRMNFGNRDSGWGDYYHSKYLPGIIEIKLPTTASGNDHLIGNGGHDTIKGGAGNDVINGTDQIVAGYLERDVLEGGPGADQFVLGDETQAYYATGGAQDYAVIQDFNSILDNLQLHGAAADYQQVQQGNDVHLTRNGDLVAILENNSNLTINVGDFDYVTTI